MNLHNYPARALGLKFSDPSSLNFQIVLKSSGIEELEKALEICTGRKKAIIKKEIGRR